MLERTVMQHVSCFDRTKDMARRRPVKFWKWDEKVNLAAHRVLHQGVALNLGREVEKRPLDREHVAAMIMKASHKELPTEDWKQLCNMVNWLAALRTIKYANRHRTPLTITPAGYAVLCRHGRSE